MKYYPIHTHLHCSHEPTASIGSHMSHAKELGIHHIWTTEHDTRMGRKANPIPKFAFHEKSLYTSLENSAQAGFLEDITNNGTYAFVGEGHAPSLRLSTRMGETERMLFHSKGKRHADPLFSRLSVSVKADVDVKEGGQVCVEFILSAQPPTYKQAKLRYVLGVGPKQEDDAPVQDLPFPPQQNGVYVFPLYTDVSEEIGGLDNALCNIALIAKDGASLTFHSLEFDRQLNFETVRKEQKKLAKQIGEKWGVTPFVGFEITGAGNHKNCFSTTVPVIDYEAYGYAVTNTMAIEHVQKHGGIFSWNHPFTRFYKREDKEAVFEELATELIENRVYGATLMEVGFPCGRDGYAAQDYLRLWDRLSEKGIMITGNGDSDNHHAVEDGWTKGNNFCTFAGLYEDETPTEGNFVKAFKRGSVWGGNPALIRQLHLFAGEKPQGSLIRGGQVCVEFVASDIKCKGYALCIVNGKAVKRLEIENGNLAGTFALTNQQKYNFARVEIYDEQNVLIAFSNPIYLVGDNTEIVERGW